MLASKHRLTGSVNFKRVQNDGVVYQSSSFGLAYLRRGDALPSKFAFVVSTKIAKDAVDRNRLKRTMSEAVRTSTIDLQPGYDVVFLAKPSINRVTTSEIMREVKYVLRQVKIIQ